MADPLEIISWDGHAIGSGSAYDAVLDERDAWTLTAQVDTQTRRGQWPVVTGTSRDARVFTLRIQLSSGLTSAQFHANINDWFDLSGNSAPRYLVRYHEDGSTPVRIGCRVGELLRYQVGDGYIITLLAPSPDFEANTATTSAADPATVTNNGTTPALPSIALTTGTHKTLRACTVNGAGAGGGLVGYPVRFNVLTASATATNVFVYINGVSVPCYVSDAGAVTSGVWAIVDTNADGTTTTSVEIFYGSGITNPLCGTLDDAGMMWATATDSTNTSWAWDDWRVSTFPSRCGVWRAGKTGNHNSAASAGYDITTEAAGGVTFSVGPASGALTNRYDSMVLTVGAKAGTTNALAGLSRVTTGLDGTNSQAYVRYRVAGSALWQTAWSTRSNATVTTSIDVDNAVEIAVGLENDGATADAATLDIASSGTTTLDLISTPTVTIAVGANVDYYNGTYVVGSYTLTFTGTLARDGTLTIDCANKTISSSGGGAVYNLPTFSDPDIWAALTPGAATTITDGIGSTDVLTYRDSYA